MKLRDIAKAVGADIVRDVVPGGDKIIEVVNGFLPGDKKLPGNATGRDIDRAVEGLPAEQRAEILGKEFDVDITQIRQSNETLRTMLESDAKNPQSTRPKIAYGAFWVVAYAVIIAISAWGWGVITTDDPLQAASGSWPFVLSIIGPFVVLLHAYFGVLRGEQKNRLDAATGRPPASGIAGALSGLLKRR